MPLGINNEMNDQVLNIGSKLLDFPALIEGVLIRRYKRFFADVELSNGEVVTAHCPNTGPMKGVLIPGGKVRISPAKGIDRKLKWTWEQAEVEGAKGEPCWVGVNTSLANKLVRLVIENGCLEERLGKIAEIRQEVIYGENRRSRIDFYLAPDECNSDPRGIFLEVKNTTWTEGALALFPDTVTVRGQKHLKELIGVLPKSRAILAPCLSRADVNAFSTGDLADPTYGELFRQAFKVGMEVVPCCFGFYREKITWEGERPLKIQGN